MNNDLKSEMFKSRAEHGEIRIGDLVKWPGRDFDDSLGGPFVVVRMTNNQFYISKPDGSELPTALHGTDEYAVNKVDTYLVWYRLKPKITILIKHHD